MKTNVVNTKELIRELEKQQKEDQNDLKKLEEQIFAFEGSYLEDTRPGDF